MEPTNAIRERIAAKRHELQGLQRRIEVLQVELRTWEEALVLITGKPLDQTLNAGTVPHPRPRSSAGGPRKRRRLTEHWQRLLGAMATDSTQRQWSLDDMETLAAVLSIEMQRNTLRSQMSIYADRNYVRRVKDGIYEVTESGAAEAGVALGPAFAAQPDDDGPSDDDGTFVASDERPPHAAMMPEDEMSPRHSGDLLETGEDDRESNAADASLAPAA